MPEIPEAIQTEIATLTRAIDDMREGRLDRDAVEQICAELLTQERANPVGRSGYDPADHMPSVRVLTGTFEERMAQTQTRDVAHLARVTRLPEDTIREFQVRCDEIVILDTIMSRGGAREYDVRQSGYYQEEFVPLMRAMDTSTSNEGQEWVPRALSNDLIQRVNLQLRVAALFRSIQMPTQPFDLPAAGVSRQRTGSLAQQTADTGQSKWTKVTPGTRKVTLSAIKLGAEALVSKEAEEDAIVVTLEWLRDELIDYLAADWEDAVHNGDTTGTHMDADVTASDDPRKQLVGLRKAAQAAQKTDGGSINSGKLSVAHLRKNRKTMGKYGIDPGKLAHIVSMSGYIDLLDDSSVITIDKLGPNATILSGQLATVDGTPVIVSEFSRTNLNATGVYDGTTITKHAATTVYRPGFIQGERRGVTTQYLTELYAESDQDAVIANMRKAFERLYPTTEGIVAQSYNLAA